MEEIATDVPLMLQALHYDLTWRTSRHWMRVKGATDTVNYNNWMLAN
jgi:hypothetical protein